MIATNAVFLPLGKEKLLLNGVDGGSYPPGYGGIEESTPLPRMNPYIDMNWFLPIFNKIVVFLCSLDSQILDGWVPY